MTGIWLGHQGCRSALSWDPCCPSYSSLPSALATQPTTSSLLPIHHVMQTPVPPYLSTHNNLTSSTKLLLLPGNHVLSVNFTVENVSDYEISSSAPTDSHATRIVCQGFVGFAFRNISHVTMCGLTINSCGKGAVIQYNYTTTAYGMSFHSVLYSSITNCSFQDSILTALGVFHSSLDLRGSNHFTSNCRRCKK